MKNVNSGSSESVIAAENVAYQSANGGGRKGDNEA